MGLFVAERAGDHVVLVDVRSDVDVASARDLEDVLASAQHGAGSSVLIVDFTSCRFIDCAGLSVLMRYHRDHAQLIVVLPPEHAIRRVFAITELDRVLTLVASRDVAIERAQTAIPE